ncbi:MAG TPA: hypothetical protein V6C72_19645, partial [Chroococcales cyanobacterium]
QAKAEDASAPPASSPQNESPAIRNKEPKNFHEGSDFKIGPVTDDSKLIKPVAGEKNKSLSDTKEKRPEKAESEEEAGMRDQRKTNQEVKVDDSAISVGALKVAADLEIAQEIVALEKWKQKHAHEKPTADIEVIALRQELDEDLFSAFLQTRRVISELDRQISGFEAVARVLEDKRDQAIRNNTILNFTSGGALAMTQGIMSVGTPMKFQNTGNELGAVAGALTMAIGAYALKIQNGGKRSAEQDPNMLAPIFGLVPVEPNKYPPVIWNYLNDYEPKQKLSRKQQLIERWKTLNYIQKEGGEKSKKKLEALCGTVPLQKQVTIALLRTRIPMLEDLRATVAGMNEYLDEILTFARGPNKVAVKYHDQNTNSVKGAVIQEKDSAEPAIELK